MAWTRRRLKVEAVVRGLPFARPMPRHLQRLGRTVQFDPHPVGEQIRLNAAVLLDHGLPTHLTSVHGDRP